MQAVVAPLPAALSAQVVQLASGLREAFGLALAHAATPHLSFHVAESYRLGALELALTTWSANAEPITVRTHGVGVFVGPQPIVTLGITRTAALSQLHSAVTAVADPLSVKPHALYAPERWAPHITLAQNGVTPANVGDLVGWLSQQHVLWEFTISSLAVLGGSDDPHAQVASVHW